MELIPLALNSAKPHFFFSALTPMRLCGCLTVYTLKYINHIHIEVCDLHVDSDSTEVKLLL